MFTDVEHGHAGARKLDLGNATGTWGFDLVATSARRARKNDVGLRAGRADTQMTYDGGGHGDTTRTTSGVPST